VECGVPLTVVEARIMEQHRRAEAARGQEALVTLLLGVVLICGGALATIGCSCLTFGLGFARGYLATSAITAGVVLVIRGLLRLRQG
jgi:hypothetical protein